jgi:hypothetical protein
MCVVSPGAKETINVRINTDKQKKKKKKIRCDKKFKYIRRCFTLAWEPYYVI